MARGLDPKRGYLFVIDGSKALRAAIDAVFDSQRPVQRCHHHKSENLMGYLPEHVKEQVKAALRAAFRLPSAEGTVRQEKQAQWLEREHPDAAASCSPKLYTRHFCVPRPTTRTTIVREFGSLSLAVTS